MKAWLLALRPKTLPAAIVPVWAGVVLAWKLSGEIHWNLALLTLVGALAIQIATNLFNDVIDAEKGADTEKRLGPKRVTASGLLSKQAVYLGGLCFLVCASICGWFLFQERGWWIIAIGLPSLYLSYGYTGGPFPLAYRGMGEVFVILFFGLVAVGGTVFVQLGRWPVEGWILGLQIGLLSALMIAVNNFRDLEEDHGSGKRTIAVRYGRPVMMKLMGIFNVLPYLLIPVLGAIGQWSGWWFWLAVLVAMPVGILARHLLRRDEPRPYNVVLGLSALQLLIFVFTFTVGMALT